MIYLIAFFILLKNNYIFNFPNTILLLYFFYSYVYDSILYKKDHLNIILKIFSFFYKNVNHFNLLNCIKLFHVIKILILRMLWRNILFKIIKDQKY